MYGCAFFYFGDLANACAVLGREVVCLPENINQLSLRGGLQEVTEVTICDLNFRLDALWGRREPRDLRINEIRRIGFPRAWRTGMNLLDGRKKNGICFSHYGPTTEVGQYSWSFNIVFV